MKKTICIIGTGYVGLPLCIEFSKFFKVIGYDVQKERILSLKKNYDTNKEIEKNKLKILKKNKVIFTDRMSKDNNIDVFIITVPTPINKKKKPELKHVISATKKIGKILKKNNLIIYESTVFPGTTEDICIPILEKSSGLKINNDFYVGYSPERLSPGNKNHGLKDIIKITSGSNNYALNQVDNLYKKIVSKGTFRAKNIKVAEAAKVIENTQRDINIAFINELVLLFSKLNINTPEVLKAAETKWNFAKFQPGLVGGHCIAVDPYYLHYIGSKKGYKPKLIIPARKVNDNMSNHVVSKTLKILRTRNFKLKDSKILILGFAYKENCSDTRNTPIYNIYKRIKDKVKIVDIIDPNVRIEQVAKDFGIKINFQNTNSYDAIIFAVPHKNIFSLLKKYTKNFKKNKNFVIDIKYCLKNIKKDIIPI